MGLENDENTRMYLQSSGQRFLNAQEGVDMFERILSQDNTQHLVLVGQPNRVHRFLGLSQHQVDYDISSKANITGKGRRTEMSGLSVDQCLEWDIKEHVSKLLKIPRDKIDIEDNLADFGLDSISLTEFANLLTIYYEVDISPALFFKYPTLEKLIQYLLTEYQSIMQEFYKDDVIENAFSSPQNKIAPDRQQRRKESRFIMCNTLQNTREPIAIIGMSGRFPQAHNIDEMWRIMTEGQSVIQGVPEDRVCMKSESQNWKCGWISGIDEFDPLFFGISPREAKTIDPRQRLLLQEAWKALEDAGYGAEQIKKNKIGIFVGAEDGNYQMITKGTGSITSSHNAILAARLAYFLNMNGPVMTINTACSSGLVAAHQAISSLNNQECDTAIVAGINLMLAPETFIGMNETGMLSADGRCYAFDKRANGMVPGEAVAVVVLKRLSQAKADQDHIYATILGSGINYDGKTNGITAPSGIAQTELLKSVYDQYQIDPEKIEYIVTHGTGTKLGDPVEVNALYETFKNYTKKQGYCALTSTKPNFGHSMAASGLVSLISLVQALRYETIPGSLNCEQENDYIHWQDSPFYVNKMAKAWPEKAGGKRIGAVSAFGMSGTNAHMVVQSYANEVNTFQSQSPYYVLVLSAKNQEALNEKINDMINLLEHKKEQEIEFSQISYTLLEGRQHFDYRCAIVIKDRENAVYLFKQIGNNERLPNLFYGRVPRNFTGSKIMEQYVQDLLKQSWSLQDKKKYQEILCLLADLYCQGYEVPWSLLFGNVKPQRISLPTYPFTREHYWISENIKPEDRESAPVKQISSFSIDDILEQVRQGKLDVERAEQMLSKII